MYIRRMQTRGSVQSIFSRAVVIVALGYLVDVYDLIVFAIVRISSLKDLGLEGDDLFSKGVLLINVQLVGLMVGGVLCGVLADKIARVPALFISIFIYSIANFTNAFIHSIDTYAICRFFAGVCLAGELGIGITLISESLQKESRSYAATFISCIGLMGAIVASVVSSRYSWRMAYIVGGALGLLLLFSRYHLNESKLFTAALKEHGPPKLIKEIFNKKTLKKYVKCFFIGLPNQFVIGILIVFSPEILSGRVPSPVRVDICINYNYLGMAIGCVIAGCLSQKFHNHRKTILIFLLALAATVFSFSEIPYHSSECMYFISALMGVACGYWAVFVLFCAESFGVNIRATASTSISNFTRGGLVLLNMIFMFLKTRMGAGNSTVILNTIVLVPAIVAILLSDDTFDREMSFLESDPT